MRRFISFFTLLIIVFPLFSQCDKTEIQWRNLFNTSLNDLDMIEGIWSVSASSSLYQYNSLINSKDIDQVVKMAVYKKGESYGTCMVGLYDIVDHSFEKSSIPGVYIARMSFEGTKSVASTNVTMNSSSYIEFEYWLPKDIVNQNTGNGYEDGYRIKVKQKWIKMYPTIKEYEEIKPISSSATGFALSQDGIIVTNNHVIQDAKSIKVRGINGNFNHRLNAEVVFSDQNNDLALIKINDLTFDGINNIPYTISTKQSDVGEDVFVLGYPLRSTMGDEIKLTNGIISSKTGYQGDITTYQISAPVQPGNSGGPVFGRQGNVIGIVSSKHMDADIATYAVKSSYVQHLIDLLDNPPALPKESILKDAPLPNQVKVIKEYVYIIEVN